jgi:hypothetical protein
VLTQDEQEELDFSSSTRARDLHRAWGCRRERPGDDHQRVNRGSMAK